MAKATTVIRKLEIDPAEKRQNDLKELEDAFLDNKEALVSAVKLVGRIHEKGAFDIAHGAVGQSDKILERIVTALDNPNVTQSLKNMLLLVEALGTVKMADLEPIVYKINSSIEKVADYEHVEGQGGGYAGLLRALKDEQVIEGMNVLFAIVRGLGINQEDIEENQTMHERSEPVARRDAPKRQPAQGKWYMLAAGALACALPLIWKRK